MSAAPTMDASVLPENAFHRFESRLHAARVQGELSPDEFGSLWLEVLGESLGPAVKLNKGYEHYWAYINHFVHAPFYVYAYAFGDLLVRSLMEKRREDPAGFVRRCPDFPVDFHWSEFREYKPIGCNACFYACRGEAQAPLRLSRLRDVMA